MEQKTRSVMQDYQNLLSRYLSSHFNPTGECPKILNFGLTDAREDIIIEKFLKTHYPEKTFSMLEKEINSCLGPTSDRGYDLILVNFMGYSHEKSNAELYENAFTKLAKGGLIFSTSLKHDKEKFDKVISLVAHTPLIDVKDNYGNDVYCATGERVIIFRR